MLTATRPNRHVQRGFTLIELMTVVIIVAVLATVAVFAVRKYVWSAKTTEAYQMINSIRSAQEAYRAETFAYCDVSGDLGNYWPKAKLGLKAAWLDTSCVDACPGFQTLGVTPNGAVEFRYSSVAGTGNPSAKGTRAEGYSLPTTGAGPWYVVQALGDQNGDGVASVFLSSSLSSDVYAEHETE
jgi:type IV pilus assembly protein PilE